MTNENKQREKIREVRDEDLARALVQTHLREIGTTNSKIAYLRDILNREKLLSKQIIIASYNLIGEFFEKKGNIENTILAYTRADNKDKLNDILRKNCQYAMNMFFSGKMLKPSSTQVYEFRLYSAYDVNELPRSYSSEYIENERLYEAKNLASRFIKLGSKRDRRNAKEITDEIERREIRDTRKKLIVDKENMKDFMDRVKSRGIYELFPYDPCSPSSRVHRIKNVFRDLNRLKKYYELSGYTSLVCAPQKQIEKETDKFVKFVVKLWLEEEEKKPSQKQEWGPVRDLQELLNKYGIECDESRLSKEIENVKEILDIEKRRTLNFEI
ncbi:hypothetical protein COU54_03900 [Candidatus Pacearchaeota archaeon CG10_big_fil_rev_8_21_14_0_10_31_24]|nr:MAG: hypothetical protein COU54_03900 [Candidatus Pacearchaeota archaeon CG10_big_fil_rev_8_21_14_0_10_31_24]